MKQFDMIIKLPPKHKPKQEIIQFMDEIDDEQIDVAPTLSEILA